MGRKYSPGFVAKHHGKWRAYLEYTEPGSKRRRLTMTTAVKCFDDVLDPNTGEVIKRDNRGKGQAELALQKWRTELIAQEAKEQASASNRSSAGSDASLYEYAAGYLQNHHVKATTLDGYRAALKRLIGTQAGNAPLRLLTAKDVKEWESDMYADGLTQTTVAHYHAFVAQVIKFAVAVGDLENNPLGAMRAPRRKPKPVNSLNSATVKSVNDALDSLGATPLSIGARLALMCGLRRGEICALRWQDVDLDQHILHINHALTKDRGYKLDTPKDPEGGDATREIPIGEMLEGWLVRRKSEMNSVVEDVGGHWSDDLYVIGNPLSGKPQNPDVLGREWKILANLNQWVGTQGQIVTLHDLRHSFATLCVANNMDIMCLASILGHRDASITLNVYSIALEQPKRASMERMDLILGS